MKKGCFNLMLAAILSLALGGTAYAFNPLESLGKAINDAAQSAQQSKQAFEAVTKNFPRSKKVQRRSLASIRELKGLF